MRNLRRPTPAPHNMASEIEDAAGVNGTTKGDFQSAWSNKYRGATVEDLDPPPALSVAPTTIISHALISGLERDYTHLTVTSSTNRSLLGYLSIPRLQQLLKEGKVKETDPVSEAMQKFRRRGTRYKVITLQTTLEELEEFFEGGVGGLDGSASGGDGGKQEFAVVTDEGRKFVLGVATRGDLEGFVRRRA